MIEAVLFDFGQTLVDSADGFRAAEKEAQSQIRADLGIAEPDALLKHYRRMRTEFQHASIYSRKTIWEAVYKHYGRQANLDKLELWEDAYWERVKERTTPFPETFHVLEELAKHYRVGLITNTQGQKRTSQHRLGEYPKIERFFQSIVVAGEGDVPPKPDRRPFDRCLAELGVEPARAVYVGDDYRNDIEGAAAAGLHPVWLKHHLVHRTWPEVETTVPTITSLEPLLELEKWLVEEG